MAEALTLSNSQLSRMLALAQMPDEVVDAFGTRDELRVRHSEVLSPILRRPEQRERVIEAARRIGEEQQRLATQNQRLIPAPTVLARLRQAGLAGTRQGMREQPIMLGAEQVGKLKQARDGLSVELVVSDTADVDALLSRLKSLLIEARSVPGDDEPA
jgi:ParB family transcriptional regulator, chromosome partitioning protein